LRSPSQIDQFNPVAVWVFDKRDIGCRRAPSVPARGRPWRPGCVGHRKFCKCPQRQGPAAEGITEIVFVGFPIVSQFDDGVAGFATVADKWQGKFSGGILSLAQQLHPQNIASRT